MGHTEWLSIKYNEEYNRLKKDCDALTGVECRVLKLHTQIVVSAEVVKRALQLPIDIDGIRKILKNEYDLKFKKQADRLFPPYA